MQFQLTHALEVLERTPATFRALLGGLTDAWTAPNEGPDTFSAFDNVGHLIHGERTDWIPRARIILEQGPNRRFEPFDRFAQSRESQRKNVTDLLDDFARLHRWSGAPRARPAGAAAFAPQALRRASPKPWRRRERGTGPPRATAQEGPGDEVPRSS